MRQTKIEPIDQLSPMKESLGDGVGLNRNTPPFEFCRTGSQWAKKSLRAGSHSSGPSTIGSNETKPFPLKQLVNATSQPTERRVLTAQIQVDKRPSTQRKRYSDAYRNSCYRCRVFRCHAWKSIYRCKWGIREPRERLHHHTTRKAHPLPPWNTASRSLLALNFLLGLPKYSKERRKK